MPRIKSKSKKEHKTFIFDRYVGILLFIVSGIMPIAVHVAERPMPPELLTIMSLETHVDALAYWKSWLLMLCALLIVIYFVSDLITGNRPDFKIIAYLKNPPVAAVAVYLLFVVLSNLFTRYPYTALHGTYERYESVFVQMAYLVIFVTVLYYTRNTKHIRYILAGLLLSSVVMGAIGISQWLRHDFFMTSLGRRVMLFGVSGNARLKYESVYGTLTNSNTFGLYTSMLAPFLLIAAFTYRGKKFVNGLLLIAGAFMLAGIPGSRSLGGMLGAAAAVVVILITYIATLIYQKKRPPLPVLAVTAFVLAGMVSAYLFIGPVQANVKTLVTKLQTELKGTEKVPDDYQFDGGALSVLREQTTMARLTAAPDGWLTVSDGNGQTVEASEITASEDGTQTTYVYQVADYGRLTLIRKADHFIFERMYFSIIEGNIIPFQASGHPIDISKPIPAIGFKGWETFASMRGYIWSRSIPLMLQHPILGTGSDTFINVFPQEDIVGKKRFMGNPYMIVDKAHNLYMQTWITTGGISALALLFLLAYYIGTTFLSLIRSRGEPVYLYGLRMGGLAAVSAFAVSSLSTDSTLGSTGVFYVILGLGYALNAIKREG